MQWPLISRRRHEAELARVKADRERIRGERNQFLRDRDTQKAVARKATEQYADLYDQHAATVIVNNHLTEDLTAARKELSEERQVSESLARQIQGLADRLRGYESVDGDDESWRSRYEAEKKRADQLQQQLDDAVGLPKNGSQDSSHWQPGYQEPKADAS
ncbi:hypothetical protein ABT215_11250 [Streptomyces sp900105755]|uniref:hypothetical protein n=1 Tax=Streptomyces sp. 900105755 TaxID=3154389 RepID=UPI003319C678